MTACVHLSDFQGLISDCKRNTRTRKWLLTFVLEKGQRELRSTSDQKVNVLQELWKQLNSA